VPVNGAEPTLESLRAWARDRIADYKAPHAMVIHDIPRNLSGKIQKNLLRAELARPAVQAPTNESRDPSGMPFPRSVRQKDF
jgi:acyl-coenzyme A synthetase/AMP-(fatty) acid ligase